MFVSVVVSLILFLIIRGIWVLFLKKRVPQLVGHVHPSVPGGSLLGTRVLAMAVTAIWVFWSWYPAKYAFQVTVPVYVWALLALISWIYWGLWLPYRISKPYRYANS